MGSEQSSQPQKKQPQRAPIRRGHTIAVSNAPEAGRSTDPPPSGRSSPALVFPKTSAKGQQPATKKSILQRRQLSLQARKAKRTRDIVVVKQASDNQLDEDIRRLQDIPTFLPIMRGTLGLPGARDPEVMEGLDYRPWVRLTTRLQAHLAACAHPLAADENNLASKIREMDAEITRLYGQMVERQRSNARHAERLSRVREISHQLTRCNSLLNQTLLDVEELNQMLPENKRLQPFVWKEE